VHLVGFANSDVVGIRSYYPGALTVDIKHNLGSRGNVFLEDINNHFYHEFHGSVIVVMQKNPILDWLFDYNRFSQLGLPTDSGHPIPLI
jgi:hypothetical protein